MAQHDAGIGRDVMYGNRPGTIPELIAAVQISAVRQHRRAACTFHFHQRIVGVFARDQNNKLPEYIPLGSGIQVIIACILRHSVRAKPQLSLCISRRIPFYCGTDDNWIKRKIVPQRCI